MAVNGSVSEDKVGREEDLVDDDDYDVIRKPQSGSLLPQKGDAVTYHSSL